MEHSHAGACVPGVILAAGRSSRMGRAKALLPLWVGGPTFVDHLITTVRQGGAADALVVGRADDDELRVDVERLWPPIRFVANPNAERGQLSSLIAGLNATDRPGIHGILVTPVDQPLISVETVSTLILSFTKSSSPIVRATYRGIHGHPVIFAREVFNDLRRADPSVGAREVLRRFDSAVLNVEVPDPGVLQDIDTPEDYERLLSRQL